MRRSPSASSARSAQIAKSPSKGDRNSIAFISASSTLSMPSFVLSPSKLHDKGAKREQNPHYSRYNCLSSAPKGSWSRRRKEVVSILFLIIAFGGTGLIFDLHISLVPEGSIRVDT